mmetsp:Transcript_16397/g.45220  ORF Transcript_16397/g.45220 Transcript_16397/m.45220 type:complete len:238 (-) Transcript_16397:22-735(-)
MPCTIRMERVRPWVRQDQHGQAIYAGILQTPHVFFCDTSRFRRFLCTRHETIVFCERDQILSGDEGCVLHHLLNHMAPVLLPALPHLSLDLWGSCFREFLILLRSGGCSRVCGDSFWFNQLDRIASLRVLCRYGLSRRNLSAPFNLLVGEMQSRPLLCWWHGCWRSWTRCRWGRWLFHARCEATCLWGCRLCVWLGLGRRLLRLSWSSFLPRAGRAGAHHREDGHTPQAGERKERER